MTIDELRQRCTVSVPEAAEVLGIGSGSAAYRAAKDKAIPGVIQVGGRLRVSVPALLDLLGVGEAGEDAA